MAAKTHVQPTSQESMLGKTVDGTDVGFGTGAFVTPSRMTGNEAAQKCLALSYAPRFSYLCDVTDEPVPPGFVDGYGDADNWSRIWPAYGQPGGALESILTTGLLGRIHKDREWDDGGGDFNMDGILIEHPGIKEGFDAAIKSVGHMPGQEDIVPAGEDEKPHDREGEGRYKAHRGGGLTGAITLLDFGVSVSLGKRRDDAGYRLWGAVWYDCAPHRLLLDLDARDVSYEEWQLDDGTFVDPRRVQEAVKEMIQRGYQALSRLKRDGVPVDLMPPFTLREAGIH